LIYINPFNKFGYNILHDCGGGSISIQKKQKRKCLKKRKIIFHGIKEKMELIDFYYWIKKIKFDE